MQLAQQPVDGVRISATYASDAHWEDLPLLQLTATSIVDIEEIWLITDDGLPVFVDVALAPFLEDMVLCSGPRIGTSPSFLLANDPTVTMPARARQSDVPSRLKPGHRRRRSEGA
jgi:hypothetical protein